MIVDTFLFGWELELLECRLYEMDSFVDVFVVVEADKTFQGTDKPLHFLENRQLFRRWLDKIIYVKAELPHTNDPWLREYMSRENIKPALRNLPDDAIVIHGDVDEIVSKVAGHQFYDLIDFEDTFVCEQSFYSMAVDWLYPITWHGSVVARNSVIRSMSMTDVRNRRVSSRSIRCGWHFSWLGGPEMIRQKASSFSHTEDSVQSYIKEMGERLYTEGYHVLGEKLIPVEIDDTYPNYIKERRCPDYWLRPRIQS